MPNRFPDVSGILEAFNVGRFGNCVPNGHVSDIERKYKIADVNDLTQKTIEFQASILPLCIGKGKVFEVLRTETFAGVDEGFVVESSNGEVHTHRLRFGSNRSPKWITKISQSSGDNTERKRYSTSIEYQDLPIHRERLKNLCGLDPQHRHLLVGQSGQFWFVKDCETGHTVELALYKAGRAESDATSPLLLLAEIAPWTVSTLEEAVPIFQKYEKLLGLTRKRLSKSNMELFAEKYA